MPKKFLVNGHSFTCNDDSSFDDIRELFKENVTLDNLENWSSNEDMFRMHSDAYGSLNFRAAEYLEIINEVEIFVQDFRKFDKKIIWNEFNDTFISVRHPEVEVRKEARILKLGAFSYRYLFSSCSSVLVH